MNLHCYCCGREYERGKFRCCAPPKNMASHSWMGQWCRVELEPGKFCNKCPRCGCEHRTAPKITGLEIGMSSLADIAPKNRGELRTQIREVGEEG